MKIKIGVECGQRWWRFSSWFPRRKHPTKVRKTPSGTFAVWRRRFAGFRRWNDGFAVGPIMVWREPRPPFCTDCNGPYGDWLMEQYGGHWDTCAKRPKGGRS